MATLLVHEIVKQHWLEASPSNGHWTRSVNGQGAKTVDEGAWQPAIDQIAAMQQLGDNWDGLGATPPSREIVECAMGLAFLLHKQGVDAPSCVMPSTAGTVVFAWHFQNGSYSDIEVDRPFHADVTWIEAGKPPETWELPDG
jgi:hypothetical protein